MSCFFFLKNKKIQLWEEVTKKQRKGRFSKDHSENLEKRKQVRRRYRQKPNLKTAISFSDVVELLKFYTIQICKIFPQQTNINFAVF